MAGIIRTRGYGRAKGQGLLIITAPRVGLLIAAAIHRKDSYHIGAPTVSPPNSLLRHTWRYGTQCTGIEWLIVDANMVVNLYRARPDIAGTVLGGWWHLNFGPRGFDTYATPQLDFKVYPLATGPDEPEVEIEFDFLNMESPGDATKRE